MVAPVLGVGLILLLLVLLWYRRRERRYESDDSFGSGGVAPRWTGVPTDDPDRGTSPALGEKSRSLASPVLGGMAGIGAGGTPTRGQASQTGDESVGGPIANIRDFEDDDQSVRTESTVSHDEHASLLHSSRNGSQASRLGSRSHPGSLGGSHASINASTSSFGRFGTTVGAAVAGSAGFLRRSIGMGEPSSPSRSRDSLNSPDTQRNVSGNTLEKHIGLSSPTPGEGSVGAQPSSAQLGPRMSRGNSSSGRTGHSSDARPSSLEDDRLFYNAPQEDRYSGSNYDTEYLSASSRRSASASDTMGSHSSGSRSSHSHGSSSKSSKSSFPRSTRGNRVSTIPEEGTPMPTPSMGVPIAFGAGRGVTLDGHGDFGIHPNASRETQSSVASTQYESAHSGDLPMSEGVDVGEFGYRPKRRGPREASVTSVDTFGGGQHYDDDEATVGRVPSLGRGSPSRAGRGQGPGGPAVRLWTQAARRSGPAIQSPKTAPGYIAAAAVAAQSQTRASLDSARTSYERPSIEVRQPTLESEQRLHGQGRFGAPELMQPPGGLKRRAAPPNITTGGAVGGDMMLSPFGPTTGTPTGSNFSHAGTPTDDWTVSSGNISTGPSATRSLGDLGSVGSRDSPRVRLFDEFGASNRASRSAPSLRPSGQSSDGTSEGHGSLGSQGRAGDSRPRNRSRLGLETTVESGEGSEKDGDSSSAASGGGGEGGARWRASGAFEWTRLIRRQ